ncbi:MAG TPA: SUMF1/EgtB/PvdO family nonheme iron enzyme, partial [Blastocatellia bacterium]
VAAKEAWESKGENKQEIKRDSKPATTTQEGRKGFPKALFAVLAILICFMAAGAYVVWRVIAARAHNVASQPGALPEVTTPAPSPAESPATLMASGSPPVPTPSAEVTPPAGAEAGEMVAIPAGQYTIGCDSGDLYAKPSHIVDLPAFQIDRTEVTNTEYKKFVDTTGHPAPENWPNGTFIDGQDKFPVTDVTWQDAADYARWAGKRLPSEAEWEAAARGPDARLYPWGNDWRKGLSNTGTTGIVEVGSFPDGASPFGALDMVGNVWEWTADEFDLYPGSTANRPADLKPGITYRVIRGGAYDAKSPTACYRGFVDGSKSYPKTGFRCGKSGVGP